MSHHRVDRNKSADDRTQAVERILADVRRRLMAGESIVSESILAGNGHLQPELAAKLRQLLRVRAARQRAGQLTSEDEPSSEAHAEPPIEDVSGLYIRCPHCHNPIEVKYDTPLQAILCSACGSRFGLVGDDPTSQPPFKRLDHFELQELLGIGGFGTVWKAHDMELDRIVALKIPRRGQLCETETETLLRKAHTAAQLKHPQIVAVHEIGRSEDSIYLVCELVRGLPLSDWAELRQPTAREAAEICATIASALHYAHEHGVVHRDLKPQNVVMDQDDQPHVMDFGLARRESGEITMTMDGQVLGTPAYMSPEQAQGRAHEADRRSDVYSLGVLLFELLTGELPFRGSVRMLIHQVLHEEAPGARKLNSQVPRDLETICQKCLEKEPQTRFQTAGELADDLHRFLRREPIRARPIGRTGRVWRWCRRNPRIAGLTAAVATTLVVLAAVSTLGSLVLARARAREQLERQLQEQVVDNVLSIFGSADPRRNRREVTVAELLDEAVIRTTLDFEDRPLLRGRFLTFLGRSYLQLGTGSAAIKALEAAKHDQASSVNDGHPSAAALDHRLAMAYLMDGQHERALPTISAAKAQMDEAFGVRDRRSLEVAKDYAVVLFRNHSDEEAKAIFEATLDRMRRVLAADDDLLWQARNEYANAIHNIDGAVKALPLYEANLTELIRVAGQHHPDTLLAKGFVASALADMITDDRGRIQDAILATDAGISSAELTARLRAHPDFPTLDEQVMRAHQLRRESFEGMEQVYGPHHPKTLICGYWYAHTLLKSADGQSPHALTIALLQELMERAERHLRDDHPLTWDLRVKYMRTQTFLERKDETWLKRLFVYLLRNGAELEPYDCDHLAMLAAHLTHVYESANEPDQAAHWQMKCGLFSQLARTMIARDFADAESRFLRIIDGLQAKKERTAEEELELRWTMAELVKCYQQWDLPDKAASWQARLVELGSSHLGN